MRFPKSVLIFLISMHAFASNSAYNYGPKKVELAGTLDLQNFPGLPNYESIAEGDKIERHFYLKLDSPIDVISTEHDDVQDVAIERNVRIIQLAPSTEFLTRLRKVGNGRHVALRGYLFHRFTGHHHARVLLYVEGIGNKNP